MGSYSTLSSAAARLQIIADRHETDGALADRSHSVRAESRSRRAYQKHSTSSDRVEQKVFQDQYFICVSNRPGNEVENTAIELGANVFPVSSIAHAQRVLEETPDQWDGLFVMRDGLMPLDHLVTELMTLRFASPDLTVVLFSNNFQADDLGGSRSPISDASLKLPISKERMMWGVSAAQTNHSRRF